MKAESLAATIADAITDELKQCLPSLVAGHCDARLREFLEPPLRAVRAELAEAHKTLGTIRDELATLTARVLQAEEETRAAETRARVAVVDELAHQPSPLEAISPQLDTLRAASAETERRFADLRDEIALMSVRVERAEAETREAETRARLAIVDELARQPPPLPGPVGPEGPPGKPGADGRDATFIAPVPWSARTFARGEIVQHRNALWFANVATDREPGTPMSGYALVLDGAMPAGVELDETGAPFLLFDFASGTRSRFALPRFQKYCGIWDATRTYYEQESVTHDGSTWIAKRTVHELRPGTDEGSAAWTLIVRRGKNGNDGKPGRDGRDAEAPRGKRAAGAAS